MDGVELLNPEPRNVDIPSSYLNRIYLTMYTPSDSESDCGSLNQLHSYRLTVPLTTAAEPNSQLAYYQSVDVVTVGLKPYKLHLKDKAKFKNLQNDENNMVVGSWQFHQYFDGLNVEDGIPLVAMSVVDFAKHPSAEHDNRYWVKLELEFFQSMYTKSINFKDGTESVDDCKRRILVWVEKANTFIECVRWKNQDTRTKWNNYNNELNNI